MAVFFIVMCVFFAAIRCSGLASVGGFSQDPQSSSPQTPACSLMLGLDEAVIVESNKRSAGYEAGPLVL